MARFTLACCRALDRITRTSSRWRTTPASNEPSPTRSERRWVADEARVLEQQLLSRSAAPFQMPRSQALLLALRDTLPLVADSVLTRSRKLYRAAQGQAQ